MNKVIMSLKVFYQKALAVIKEEFDYVGDKKEFEISQSSLDKINRIYILSAIINNDNFLRLADIITHSYNVHHVTVSLARNSLHMPILQMMRIHLIP
jgi:transcriptional regulator of aromatic amino acid metabolism